MPPGRIKLEDVQTRFVPSSFPVVVALRPLDARPPVLGVQHPEFGAQLPRPGMSGLPAETQGSGSGSRLATETKRKDRKVAQRKRTRDLHDKLDLLVPLSATRPPEAEKGTLVTGRTWSRLQGDTIEHLRKLKAERLRRSRDGLAGHFRCGGAPASEVPCMRRPDIHMHAMLSSSMLFLLEVDVSAWTVLRASAGVRALYRYHPRGGDSIVGECLLHYIDLGDTTALRTAAQKRLAPGQVADAPDVLLRTFMHGGGMQCFRFRVQRFGSSSQDKELLMLHPFCGQLLPEVGSMPELSACSYSCGWTMEKMRDMSGIYKYDWNNTTLPPWVLDAQLGHMEAGGGCSQMALVRLFSTQTSKDAVHSLVAPQGTSPTVFNTWSTRLKTLLHNMCEMQFTFFRSDTCATPILTIHIRLRMPGAAGALRTPWVLFDRFTLDGTSASKLPGAGKEIRVLAQSCGLDELRLCSLYFRSGVPDQIYPGDRSDTSPPGRTCYHTRQWVLDGRSMRISGELSPTSHETPMPFIESFKRVEDADRALVSSLLASESIGDAELAAAAVEAGRASASLWEFGGFFGGSPVSGRR